MYLPGNPKIKPYSKNLTEVQPENGSVEKTLFNYSTDGNASSKEKKTSDKSVEDVKTKSLSTEKKQKVGVYVDKSTVSVKTTVEIQTSEKDKRNDVSPRNKAEKGNGNDVKPNKNYSAEQLSLFDSEPDENYKKAKKTASRFMDLSVEVYETYKDKKQRSTFNKTEMLKGVNEYVQSLIIACELSKNENADENRLQFALDIGWFGNLFEGADNLDALKRLAKTHLLQVPTAFTSAVILDLRENTELCRRLFACLKKLFGELYSDGEKAFEILTKPLVDFIVKQGITL